MTALGGKGIGCGEKAGATSKDALRRNVNFGVEVDLNFKNKYSRSAQVKNKVRVALWVESLKHPFMSCCSRAGGSAVCCSACLYCSCCGTCSSVRGGSPCSFIFACCFSNNLCRSCSALLDKLASALLGTSASFWACACRSLSACSAAAAASCKRFVGGTQVEETRW